MDKAVPSGNIKDKFLNCFNLASPYETVNPAVSEKFFTFTLLNCHKSSIEASYAISASASKLILEQVQATNASINAMFLGLVKLTNFSIVT